MTAHFLAIDLGAESGRAMLGRLGAGGVSLAEICRFPNGPVRDNGSLRWDINRLWSEIRRSLDRAADRKPDSIGIDTWGCDYALLDARGQLVEQPYHYRDVRTDGVMEAVWQRVSREEIYAITGIQFLVFNTLYQLYAACQKHPALIASAASFGTIPDLLNYWLTGELRGEFTMATTTQFVDATTRDWARELLARLDIPTRLLPPMIEQGSVLGPLKADACAALAGTPVVTPATHDTGSAVASVLAGRHTAFISSGTWSLLGTEVIEPVITPRARDLNFTNEGGVCGTTRLLKNVMGLWILQGCRKSWSKAGSKHEYQDIVRLAVREPAFQHVFNPDDERFLRPDDMLTAIDSYCTQTDQAKPASVGAYVRAVLESLALKYRRVIREIESLTARRIEQIRIIGGG